MNVEAVVFNSASLCCIATDEKGAIRTLSAGAEGMLGYAAADVRGRMFAELCDPEELVARAEAVSLETRRPVAPGFEALVCNASFGGEDLYALTYVRRNGSRLSAMVSVSALRGDGDAIVGYVMIGTDNTARRDAEEALHALAATLAVQDRKPIALVVDDDDRAAAVLRLFLEAEGFAVVHSISAEHAILEAPKHTLALITLDLQMYGLNGWQFLKQLRESGEALSRVPVIIATGQSVDDDLAESRGAAAILQKPVGRAPLKAALAGLGLLNRPQAG